MRVMIVDDHSIMRSGMRSLVEKREGVTVVSEAGTAAEAIDMAESARPDVILMDIELPDGSGIGATDQIIKNRWCEKIVMVSAHADRASVASSLEAGARGYLLKSGANEEIFAALDEVFTGGSYVTPMVAGGRGSDPFSLEPPRDAPLSLLSPREIQVLARIAEGLASKEIGRELAISHRTVETHRTNLMRKLKVRKASELVRLAIREGLVDA